MPTWLFFILVVLSSSSCHYHYHHLLFHVELFGPIFSYIPFVVFVYMIDFESRVLRICVRHWRLHWCNEWNDA